MQCQIVKRTSQRIDRGNRNSLNRRGKTMKESHFKTPRTLEECYFDPRGQAIELPEKPSKGIIAWILSLLLPR